VAIVQSNYIPWKGYFDIINMVDEFILFDDRQYTRRDWRNRNLIKTAQGLHWLTIPVQTKGRFEQRIDETMIGDSDWADKHWKTILNAYRSAPFFDQYEKALASVYRVSGAEPLSIVNRRFLEAICDLLQIGTRLSWSTDYPTTGHKTERLVNLCRLAGATAYVSGPAARVYLEEEQFLDAGIELTYMDYSNYPEYEQLHGPFEHGVSIIDLLFNAGPDAHRYMKSFGAAVVAP
jgi:WbqC-like protein family